MVTNASKWRTRVKSFEVSLTPKGDTVTIYGNFSDDGQYVGLLKYQVEE